MCLEHVENVWYEKEVDRVEIYVEQHTMMCMCFEHVENLWNEKEVYRVEKYDETCACFGSDTALVLSYLPEITAHHEDLAAERQVSALHDVL
jgi:hypothetical protein